jgi:hypothetical protein
MTRPDLQSIAPHFKRYVEYVKDQDMLEALNHSGKTMIELIRTIPETKGEHRYEPSAFSLTAPSGLHGMIKLLYRVSRKTTMHHRQTPIAGAFFSWPVKWKDCGQLQ